MKNKVILFLLFIGLMACEDKIDISKTLKASKPVLVVDAFLTNLPSNQVVHLMSSQYYFDNSGPIQISGATVKLVDLSLQKEYLFNETAAGQYASPVKGDSMLIVDHPYQLLIEFEGQVYSAYSQMTRVPPIDSIFFDEVKDINDEVIAGKYEAEFRATDPVGFGDRVWIRYYKNDVRDVSADKIGVAYDGGFSESAGADGNLFIYPLRRFPINEDTDGDLEKLWKDGQKITVELFSITEEAAFFLQAVVTQATLGSNGPLGALFSPPPANVPTNIVNTTSKEKEAAGFFCVSAVSRAETVAPNAYGKQ